MQTLQICWTPSPGGSCSLSSLRDEVQVLPGSWVHSRLLGTLPQVVPVVSAPSEMRCVHSPVNGHTPPVLPVVSAPSEMRCEHSPVNGHTPPVLPVVSAPSEMRCTHSPNGWWGREGTGAVAAGEFPSAPEGLFLFRKNPPAPSCGSLCTRKGLTSHTAHLSRPGAVWVRMALGPTFNSPWPAPVVPLGFPLHPYSPHCDFRQPGHSQCCSGLVWQWRGPLTRLSPRSPVAGPARAGLGLQLPWSPCWSQGPFCLEAISLPSVFSVSSVLFGLLSS